MATDTWLWIIAGFVAAIFLGTGLLQLTTARERLVGAGLGWAGDFSDRTIRTIGTLELLGAVGLVLPPALGILPVLAPLAATGLALLMVGAIVVHVRRGEVLPEALRALALVVLCVVIAAYRFGPEAF